MKSEKGCLSPLGSLTQQISLAISTVCTATAQDEDVRRNSGENRFPFPQNEEWFFKLWEAIDRKIKDFL